MIVLRSIICNLFLRRLFLIAFPLTGLAGCFSGCSIHPLTVQTQYLSHEDLASYHIGTPDPSLDNPDVGERLLIQWSLSSCQLEGGDLRLHLKVRFTNHQEEEINVPVEKKKGYYLYNLLNQDYCDKGGILTYLAEIRSGECVVAVWKHPLWTNLITFDRAKVEVNNE